MKKFFNPFLSIIVVITIIVLVLNVNVTTRKGVNFQWHTIKLPLYLKILDFFDRHYNYKQLVKIIIRDAKTDQERVMKIFEWTYKNLKKVPEGLPVVDDHVWYIIVRGYGASDQFCYVFATLCNYAGLEAFYSLVYTYDRAKSIPLCFVKIGKKWRVFDPYYGVYFKDKTGNLADIVALKSGSWTAECNKEEMNSDYALYFHNFTAIKETDLNRTNIQSPLKRLLFEIKKHKR